MQLQILLQTRVVVSLSRDCKFKTESSTSSVQFSREDHLSHQISSHLTSNGHTNSVAEISDIVMELSWGSPSTLPYLSLFPLHFYSLSSTRFIVSSATYLSHLNFTLVHPVNLFIALSVNEAREWRREGDDQIVRLNWTGHIRSTKESKK